MLIFGIDTCCMAATAAILSEDRLVAETVVNQKKTHSEKMMPQIDAMFKSAEVSPSEIDCFAAAVGPGSFTGVRIGVSTVKALAHATGKPCAAVSTLHALANNVRVFDGVICPILDARRGQVYNALFTGGRTLSRLCDDRALALEELLEELKDYKSVLFVGDGVPVHRAAIEAAMGDRAQFAPLPQLMNLAGSVASLAAELYQNGETVPHEDLVPQYVRLSQAEREKKMQKDGSDQ